MKTTFVNLQQYTPSKGHMAIWTRVSCHYGLVGMKP